MLFVKEPENFCSAKTYGVSLHRAFCFTDSGLEIQLQNLGSVRKLTAPRAIQR